MGELQLKLQRHIIPPRSATSIDRQPRRQAGWPQRPASKAFPRLKPNPGLGPRPTSSKVDSGAASLDTGPSGYTTCMGCSCGPKSGPASPSCGQQGGGVQGGGWVQAVWRSRDSLRAFRVRSALWHRKGQPPPTVESGSVSSAAPAAGGWPCCGWPCCGRSFVPQQCTATSGRPCLLLASMHGSRGRTLLLQGGEGCACVGGEG